MPEDRGPAILQSCTARPSDKEHPSCPPQWRYRAEWIIARSAPAWPRRTRAVWRPYPSTAARSEGTRFRTERHSNCGFTSRMASGRCASIAQRVVGALGRVYGGLCGPAGRRTKPLGGLSLDRKPASGSGESVSSIRTNMEENVTPRYSDRKKTTCKVTLSSGSRVGEGSVVDMTVPGCQLETAFPLEPGQ